MGYSVKKIGLVALLSGFAAFSAPALSLADGMAEGAPSLLDRALMDIQTQNQPRPQPSIADKTSTRTQPEQEEVRITETRTVVPVETREEPLTVPQFSEEIQMEQAPVRMAPENRTVMAQGNTSFLGLSVGAYDPFTNGDLSGAFGLEYQPGFRVFGRLQPLFGAMATVDGTYMGYGGLGVPIQLSDNWMLMPSAAIGYYKDGSGVDLGTNFIYRIGTELAYVFENKSRIGLNAHVITNGDSLNSHDRTEVISIVYTMPIGYTPDNNSYLTAR